MALDDRWIIESGAKMDCLFHANQCLPSPFCGHLAAVHVLIPGLEIAHHTSLFVVWNLSGLYAAGQGSGAVAIELGTRIRMDAGGQAYRLSFPTPAYASFVGWQGSGQSTHEKNL